MVKTNIHCRPSGLTDLRSGTVLVYSISVCVLQSLNVFIDCFVQQTALYY